MRFFVGAMWLAAVAVSTPALADGFSDGLAAFERREFAAALAAWEPLAFAGDAEAQYRIADLYRLGKGVPAPDYGLALEWFRSAADSGHPAAHSSLGFMFYYGLGVHKNDRDAAYWYRLAAELGDPLGQYHLGRMISGGIVFSRDEAEGAVWYRRSAQGGYAPAQVQLGLRYADGRGVERDLVEAVAWLSVAAERPDAWIEDAAIAVGPLRNQLNAAQRREAGIRSSLYWELYVVPILAP